MKRFYNRFRPGCPKDDGGVTLVPDERSGDPAPVFKSRVPPTANAQRGLDLQNASLEGLPVELQCEILQRLPCLPSLATIVHASPSFHKIYVARRQPILTEVVSRDIGRDVLVEAHAVVKALTIDTNDGSNVREFLEDYQNARREVAAISLGEFSLPQIGTLSRLHYAVRSAMNDFCQATLSKHPISGKKLEDIMPLSVNEARRTGRAFFRFELFCTIFNQSELEGNQMLDSMAMCHLFLNQFPAWEVEEIACVRDYIVDRYAHLFAKYKHVLVQQSPQGAPEDSSGDEKAFEDVMLEYYKERCMSHGLGFLHRISQASTFDQVRMLKKNLIDTHFFLTRTLGEDPYDYVYGTNAFGDWINKLPLRFVTDDDGPNAAWTWSNGDKVELFPFQLSKWNLRKWGYVMWDKERLDRWGVLESSNEEYVRQCYE